MADEARAKVERVPPVADVDAQEGVLSEEYQAQRVAERLGVEYVDLEDFEIGPELFRSIPVDLAGATLAHAGACN